MAELYRNADSDTVKEAITQFIDETGESLKRGYKKVKDDPWGTVKEGAKGVADGIADAGEAMVDEGKVALVGDEEMLALYGREDAVTAQRLITAVRVGGNAAALLGLTKVAKYGAEKAADGLGSLKDKVEDLAKKEKPEHESGRKGVENANANADGDFDALNQEPKAVETDGDQGDYNPLLVPNGVLTRGAFDKRFEGKFTSQTEADEAFKQYEAARSTDSELVLGRLQDTKAGSQLGMERLHSDNWTPHVNDLFIQGGIDAGKPFYLGSKPGIANYRAVWNVLEGNRGSYPQTVFFKRNEAA